MISRKYLIILPTIAFACLLIAGLVVSAISLKAATPEEWLELKDSANILSGESTRRFTKLLNKHFILGPAFNRIERGILWNLIGDLGPSVRAGCDDWLYLSDELEVHPDRLKSARFRAMLAAKLDSRLQQRGIKLLVVVVPDKTRIESAHLCGLNRASMFGSRVVSWQALLTAQGVETLDLTSTLSAMPGERYYHTDTHWNEAGANASAGAVASALNALHWATVAPNGAVTLNPVRAERPGDLVHLAGLDGLPGFLRPKVEMAQVTNVSPVAVASDDLFGDAGLPEIALIGTSYSRNSNFVPFLEHHLGVSVANLAKDGGDFSGAATAYFSGSTFRSSAPKVVIWEVPERVIEKPINDAERKWLETLVKAKL
ncbi:MAG: cell division protein FtsQ [Proteobacteria bacterium]|nr:cell division protein FtsQ [Pseudomonadota bacterium]